MSRFKKGFTLMEMMIVVAIIAVLVAVAIPTFTSSLQLVRETTCAANRRSLKAQLAIEQMTTQAADYEAVANTPQGQEWVKNFVCPSGGTVSVKKNLITCSKHGGTVATVQANFQDIMEHYKDYGMKYLNNDLVRAYYVTKYGNWPPLEIGGTKYHVQAYYDKTQKSVTIYARTDSGTSNWNAQCIYDAEEGVWYSGKKPVGMVGQSWTDIESRMKANQWTAVPSGEISS